MAITYDDAEVDAALDRIATDITRRFDVPEFSGPAMAALLEELRQMEKARRSGDLVAAGTFAASAAPALETYRPTNATSRAKAVLGEVVAALAAHGESPVE